MWCPSCGKSNDDSASSCEKCGALFSSGAVSSDNKEIIDGISIEKAERAESMRKYYRGKLIVSTLQSGVALGFFALITSASMLPNFIIGLVAGYLLFKLGAGRTQGAVIYCIAFILATSFKLVVGLPIGGLLFGFILHITYGSVVGQIIAMQKMGL